MLNQNDIVEYKGEKAKVLGFMKDNTICIEILGDCESQFYIIYVDRNEIKQTKSC